MVGAAGGWYLGSQAGHRAVADGLSGVLGQFHTLQAAMGNLASQVGEDMTRAASARNRATSAEANAKMVKARDAATTLAMSEDGYRSHLAAGGAVIPDVERALGLIS